MQDLFFTFTKLLFYKVFFKQQIIWSPFGKKNESWQLDNFHNCCFLCTVRNAWNILAYKEDSSLIFTILHKSILTVTCLNCLLQFGGFSPVVLSRLFLRSFWRIFWSSFFTYFDFFSDIKRVLYRTRIILKCPKS